MEEQSESEIPPTTSPARTPSPSPTIEPSSISETPKLTYFQTRGRAETIRIILAANEINYDEVYLQDKETYTKLCEDELLLFGQVPLLEMDGLKMVQSSAICRYLGRKFNLFGSNAEEEFRVDMIFEGIRDFLSLFLGVGFLPENDVIDNLKQKALPRYMTIYQQLLRDSPSGFLVGNHLSLADIGLFEILLNVDELFPTEISKYSLLEEFLRKFKSIPSITNYIMKLRQPFPTPEYASLIKNILS